MFLKLGKSQKSCKINKKQIYENNNDYLIQPISIYVLWQRHYVLFSNEESNHTNGKCL